MSLKTVQRNAALCASCPENAARETALAAIPKTSAMLRQDRECWDIGLVGDGLDLNRFGLLVRL